jgi:transglutaminase-like putative cysteine protease
MPFEQAFKLSSLLLAATAFSGVVLARGIPAWIAVITGLALILAMLGAAGIQAVLRSSQCLAIPARLRNLALLLAFAFFLIDLTVSRELLTAGIHFLVVLLIVKLTSLEERRDFRQLYAISLMAILASAALTTEAWFIPVFASYLLTAVWTLLLYHLTGAHQAGAPAGNITAAPMSISGRFFWLTNGIAIATFSLTLLIFFLLPRIGAGILQKSRGEGLKTTGFSERVDLGMIGSVKQDPQVVMRVELPDRPVHVPDRLYLRGVAYDQYDGRSWSAGNIQRRNLGTFGDGTFAIRPSGARQAHVASVSIQQDILLEALDTSVLFAVPFAEYLSGDLTGVQSDGMGALYLPFPASSRIRYSVTSRVRDVVDEERRATMLDYPRQLTERYLPLPKISDDVRSLTQQIVRDAPAPFDRILAIQQYLLHNYRYSLDLETTTSLHPLEDFLFTRKSGYCEHYATAMAVMLRSVGIPARLVTGFLATEWNQFGGYFTVRQRDAHAWVEVYFPQSGWTTFDPTPPTGAPPAPSGLDALFRAGESLRLYWDRLFIRYSAKDQFAVIQGIRDGGDAVRDLSGRWTAALHLAGNRLLAVLRHLPERAAADGVVTLILPALLGVGALAILLRKTLRFIATPEHPTHRQQSKIIKIYRQMIHTVDHAGFAKSPAATPLEFAGMVAAKWTVAGDAVSQLTEIYCRGRFSGIQLTVEELAHAERQLRALQRLPAISP